MAKKHHEDDSVKADNQDSSVFQSDSNKVGTDLNDPNQNEQNQNVLNQDQIQQQQQDQQNRQGLQSGPVVTADDMKGTVTDPVSYSNPAFDPSEDAQKVELRGKSSKDKEKIGDETGTHKFKPGHFYKKGDVVEYLGTEFEALQDLHGDLPPSLWAKK
jgi:hypothetical protein